MGISFELFRFTPHEVCFALKAHGFRFRLSRRCRVRYLEEAPGKYIKDLQTHANFITLNIKI